MRRTHFLVAALATLGIGAAFASAPVAQARSYDPALFSNMQWRDIGPLRGGRMRALDGVPSQPNVFYAGADNGGVWKSDDYGQSWHPIFDDQPTGSIGAIAVAPSDPSIIYVGSGEGIFRPDGTIGNGMYKSTDGGKTWTHLGLRDTQKISQVVVDPNDPDRLFVAAIGHPYGPNEERGIFRSTDGGKTFQKVLYTDEYTGGDDVDFDPSNPQIVYATMWQNQKAPWENGEFKGTSGGLYKSTDGGDTWHKLTRGLPEDLNQIIMSVAPSDPDRLYASVATLDSTALYRSDDAGASWRLATTDKRASARIGGGDLPPVIVDPKNADIVYSCTPVLWKSTDGGKTWAGLRGGPGGDDYQNLWINPNNPDILFSTVDQGTIVSVNGGRTWSSWYNQPTAAMYKVSTTDEFPYRVCGGQQDSGSACVSSRGNDGQLTTHDWHPVGIEEYGGAAPDPLNPEVIYGGKVTRYNGATGQIQYVGPPREEGVGRVVRTMPVVFSPIDPHTLYATTNVVWQTQDDGHSWQKISPDLTRKGNWKVPGTVGKYARQVKADSKNRAVVKSLAPSPLDKSVLWAGTDDGQIQVTQDGGKTWNNVTPPQLKPWWTVFEIDAGHFDPGTAYAAINTYAMDDLRPHLFRTHDYGKTWTAIDNGIPGADSVYNNVTNVIREDTKRQGLLFAGTETQVFVSFDDGDHWESLRLNMPAISVRDLKIKNDDLVIATHGRGFWILDDISPLRQINDQIAQAAVTLYKPGLATRVRWGMNPPTPWRLPFRNNPPAGAVIDYYLADNASGPVTLDILDANGQLVRHYSSANPDQAIPADKLGVPVWWQRPPEVVSTEAGHHRFVWDMHYTPIPGLTPRLDATQAVKHKTPKTATSPWVLPGEYTVKLTVNGHSYTQPMKVRMDPRVTSTPDAWQKQFALAKDAYDETMAGLEALGQIRDLQKQLAARADAGSQAVAAYQKKLDALAGPANASPFFFYRYSGPPVLASAAWQLRIAMGQVENADMAPTQSQAAAITTASKAMQGLVQQWHALQAQPLAQLNADLEKANLAPVRVLADAGVPDRWDWPWVKYYRADM